MDIRRRTLLAGAASGLGALAGCITRASHDDEAPTGRSPTNTSESPVDEDALTGWEKSADCERTPTGMYDSVIKVEEVTTELRDGYVPIRFSELTSDEKGILRTVTEEGGYATCDTSDGFLRFIQRVGTHREKQSESAPEDMHIYLEREGTYYRLYVEKLDEVYAY